MKKKIEKKKKQPIKRYVSGLALERLKKCLISAPPTFYYRVENFYFFLDIFYRLKTDNQDLWIKEESEYYAISCEYFKKVITNGTYRKHLQYLKDIGVVLIDEHYKEGIAKGYFYNPIYESKLVEVLITPEMPIWKKIIGNRNNKRSHKAMPEHLLLMKKAFKKIEFDYNGAQEYLDTLLKKEFITQNEYNVRYMSLERIRTGNFYFDQNKTNYRVDSNLTNMKKELRNFLVGDYIQIDLKNSQPYLLNYVLSRYSLHQLNSYNIDLKLYSYSFCGEETTLKPLNSFIDKLFRAMKKRPLLKPKEVEKYHKWTTDGKVYNLFMTELNIQRDKAKELFLATMYSKNHSKTYRVEHGLFRKQFPTIYKLIAALKLNKKEYSKLAIAMQNLEVEIFIDVIAKRLVEKGIVPITVHDAVIVKKQQYESTMEVINGVFMDYFGEIPSFDPKELSPDSDEINKSLLNKPGKKEKKKKNVFSEQEYQESIANERKEDEEMQMEYEELMREIRCIEMESLHQYLSYPVKTLTPS